MRDCKGMLLVILHSHLLTRTSKLSWWTGASAFTCLVWKTDFNCVWNVGVSSLPCVRVHWRLSFYLHVICCLIIMLPSNVMIKVFFDPKNVFFLTGSLSKMKWGFQNFYYDLRVCLPHQPQSLLTDFFYYFFSRYSWLRARKCQPTAGLISTCPQTGMNDHPASLGVTCGQRIGDTSGCLLYRSVLS